MRIRKHASKILGSASCQAWPSAPTPSVDDPAPPNGEVCELNQSPWDVLPSPQLPELHLSDLPHLKVEEDEDDDDDDDDHIILSVVRRNNEKKKKKKKKNKKDVAKMENDEMSGIASLNQCKQSCNKSDGKGWRCKKPAQIPHTLCQYHLAQLRSYNAAYRAPAVTAGQRKPNTGSSGNTGTGLYYYYSGFGPWRGKRRSGEKVAEDDDDDDDNEEGERAEVVENGGNGKEIDNVDDDGSDGDEELEEKKRKSGGHCGKKRGRRRIKARSLKSLL